MNTITDYIFETEHRKNIHNVFEMSLISDSKDNLSKNSKIYVYGENDEQGTKPPHFHVKMDNRYEFEIKFDDFNSLKIWRSKNVKHDWKNYSDIKKEIKNWLVSKNIETPEYTNMQVILTEWNRENPNYKINKEYYINKFNLLNNI